MCPEKNNATEQTPLLASKKLTKTECEAELVELQRKIKFSSLSQSLLTATSLAFTAAAWARYVIGNPWATAMISGGVGFSAASSFYLINGPDALTLRKIHRRINQLNAIEAQQPYDSRTTEEMQSIPANGKSKIGLYTLGPMISFLVTISGFSADPLPFFPSGEMGWIMFMIAGFTAFVSVILQIYLSQIQKSMEKIADRLLEIKQDYKNRIKVSVESGACSSVNSENLEDRKNSLVTINSKEKIFCGVIGVINGMIAAGCMLAALGTIGVRTVWPMWGTALTCSSVGILLGIFSFIAYRTSVKRDSEKFIRQINCRSEKLSKKPTQDVVIDILDPEQNFQPTNHRILSAANIFTFSAVALGVISLITSPIISIPVAVSLAAVFSLVLMITAGYLRSQVAERQKFAEELKVHSLRPAVL